MYSANCHQSCASVRLFVHMSVLYWVATLQAISDPYSQTACLWLSLCVSASAVCLLHVREAWSVVRHVAYRLVENTHLDDVCALHFRLCR